MSKIVGENFMHTRNGSSLDAPGDTSGFSLTSVMIAGVLVSVLAMMFAQLMNYQIKSVQGMRLVSSRDQLKNLLDRYSGDPKALDKSSKFTGSGAFPANTNLDYCVNGTDTCGNPGNCCVANTAGSPTPHDLTLTDPQGLVMTGPNSGTPATYDMNGARCAGTTPSPGPSPSPGSANCPLIAYASFIADCGGADTCKTAKRITVTYTLQQAPGVQLTVGPKLKTLTGSVISGIPLLSSLAGSTNYLAKWLSTTNLGSSSSVYEDPATGNVGIGTTTPRFRCCQR